MWPSLISQISELTQCHLGNMWPNIVLKQNHDQTCKVITSFFHDWGCPVGWDCRIRRLHLCRRVRPHPQRRPWVATHKALGQNPSGWAVIDPATESSMTCNTPLWPLLGLMDGQIGPIQSIGWSCQPLEPIYFILTVLLNLHLQQVPNPYLLGARRWWLKVNCIERIGIWPENRNLVAYPHFNQVQWVTPLVHFQNKLDSMVGGRAQSQWKIYSIYDTLQANLLAKAGTLKSLEQNVCHAETFKSALWDQNSMASISDIAIARMLTYHKQKNNTPQTITGNVCTSTHPYYSNGSAKPSCHAWIGCAHATSMVSWKQALSK